MMRLLSFVAPTVALVAASNPSLSSHTLPLRRPAAVGEAFVLVPPSRRSVRQACRPRRSVVPTLRSNAVDNDDGGDAQDVGNDGRWGEEANTATLSDDVVAGSDLPYDGVDDGEDDEEEEDFDDTEQLRSFSKSFRRYRIDFSVDESRSRDSRGQDRIKDAELRSRDNRAREKIKNDAKEEDAERRKRRTTIGLLAMRPGEEEEEKKKKEGLFYGFGAAIEWAQASIKDAVVDRRAVEERCVAELEKKGGRSRFRWVTTETSPSGEPLDTPIDNGGRIDNDTDDRPRTYADEDLVAAAAFWRMAADVAESVAGSITNDGRTQTLAVEEQWILALPETTLSVARRLCDINNWFADLQDSELGREGSAASVIVRARVEVDDRSSVPLVVFTPTVGMVGTSSSGIAAFNGSSTSSETEARTKAWVRRVLVKLKICPFTKSDSKSGQGMSDLGVPVADIMYRHSDAVGRTGMYALMADAWEAISDMIAAGPSGESGVSSILLSAPGFDGDFDLWAGPVFAMLEAGVGAVQAAEMVGVVCFHPKYATPDGKSWPGFGHMHSLPRLRKWLTDRAPDASKKLSDGDVAAGGAWQRRTPHAVINVLRADQLEAAEGRRATGVLYARNVRVLVGKDGEGVGSDRLAEELEQERSMSLGSVK